MKKQEMIRQMEERFRSIVLLQYDTSIPVSQVDREVAPYLHENVTFKDPWQTGKGKDRYRAGQKGFHCMFRFDFDITQLAVRLNDEGTYGRALVDGTMNLRQLSPLLTYPLRTILAYDFIVENATDGEARFLITDHEEMWSYGDMIENVPGVRPAYDLFRKCFGTGFVLASKLSVPVSRLLARPVAQ